MVETKKNMITSLIFVTAIAVLAIIISASQLVSLAHAGEANIVDVRATQEASGTWRFDVTVEHEDTGWEHYADRWDVLSADGVMLGERVLLHPHVNEQPFTRSLRGVVIPDDVTEIIVRAHDSVHALGGEEMTITLDR